MGKNAIRIGMIGTGVISHSHVSRLLQENGVRIAALADPSESGRETLIQRYSLHEVQSYDSHKEMLERCPLDALVICTPHTLHYEHARDALALGKHVLIEKPFTCSSKEAEELIALAKDANLVLMVSYQRRFYPQFCYIRDAIANGTIGSLTSVTGLLIQDWKDSQAGTWRQIPSLSGGGMLMDSGSHILDTILWTTGLTPTSVAPQLHCHEAPVEIDSFTAIRFGEGPIGSLNIIGKSPSPYFSESYAFIGEKGGLFYDNRKVVLRLNGENPIEPELSATAGNPDNSFVESIRGRRESEISGEDGLRVVRVIEMIYEAAGYRGHTAAEH